MAFKFGVKFILQMLENKVLLDSRGRHWSQKKSVDWTLLLSRWHQVAVNVYCYVETLLDLLNEISYFTFLKYFFICSTGFLLRFQGQLLIYFFLFNQYESYSLLYCLC